MVMLDTSKLAARIKLMIYNGKKLTDPECEALAIYSAVNDLNPFVGECYYLPGIGPSPGIAGWRKKADEQLEYEARRAACPSARFWCDYVETEPRETGALAAGDIAVKAILHDTITKMQWEQRILSSMIELMKNKIEHARELAMELTGPEPVWSAIGIVRAVENFGQDKMPRYERACKRAEKASIRKRFPRVYLPEPVGYEDVIDGEFAEAPAPKISQAQALSELGFTTPGPDYDLPGQASAPPIPPEPAPEQPAQQVEEPSSMVSIEMARAMRTSDGKTYGEMDAKTLAAVASNIQTAMNKPDVDAGRREELQLKLDCALTVLRANKPKTE
jgi:hypothetical protein